MGVIYKLKPEIKNYIIEQKKNDPNFSCRKLPAIVLNKFQVKLSKSTINTIIKEAGLSSTVGRKPKPGKRGLANGSGVFFLKAMDSLCGGSFELVKLLKNKIQSDSPGLLEKTEFLLYSSLFGKTGDLVLNKDSGIWGLINSRLNQVSISFYLSELQRIKELPGMMSNVFQGSLRQVHSIKLEVDNKFICFIDGKFHLAWASNHMPEDFSSPFYHIDNYLNSIFNDGKPFVFFMSAGYETPTNEFINLISTLNSKEPRELKITYYDNKLKEIKNQIIKINKQIGIIFGLWPWQFSSNRQIELKDNLQKISLKPLDKEYYISPAKVELTASENFKGLKIELNGFTLKLNPQDNPRLYVLSNPVPLSKNENICLNYLKHWPNLSQTLQDFSKKMESFKFAKANSIPDKTAGEEENNGDFTSLDIYKIISSYLIGLSNQFGHYYLPSNQNILDFQILKERFYDLPATIEQFDDSSLVTFITPIGYNYLGDLEYACNRLNESEIYLFNRNKTWFRVEPVTG